MSRNPSGWDGHDDRVLVQHARNGDSDAFGVLYVRHMDAIYRYIYFRVGEELEAEDLTEDVFIKAWQALPTYQYGEYPFKSWLYRIAHNLVIDYHRKHRTVSLPDLDLQDTESAPSSEDRLVSKQSKVRLAEAISQLGEEEQQVILLRFVEGLSHREVGVIIGKSEGACRIIQHRALAALYSFLSNQQDG